RAAGAAFASARATQAHSAAALLGRRPPSRPAVDAGGRAYARSRQGALRSARGRIEEAAGTRALPPVDRGTARVLGKQPLYRHGDAEQAPILSIARHQ